MKELHMKVYPRTGEAEFNEVKQTLTGISNNASTNALVRSDIASILAHADNIVTPATEFDAEELKAFVRHLEQLALHKHMIPADRTILDAKIAAFKAKYFLAPKGVSKVKLAISGLVLAATIVGGAMKPGLPEKKGEHVNGKTLLTALIEKPEFVNAPSLEAKFDALWEDIRKDARFYQKLTRRENTLDVTEVNPADELTLKANRDLVGVMGDEEKTITLSASSGSNTPEVYVLKRKGNGPVLIEKDNSGLEQLADETNVGDILKVLAKSY